MLDKNGCSCLAATVIKAALDDRKDYMEKFKLNQENDEVLTELEDLEEFFKSELFVMYCNLCDMNPNFIKKYLKENNCDQQRLLAKSLQDRQKAKIKENQTADTAKSGNRNKSKSVWHASRHRSSVKDGGTGSKDCGAKRKHPRRRKTSVRGKKAGEKSNLQHSK